MSWLDELSRELSDRGVRGSDRRRILLELADHVACEPACEDRLGDPRELASAFADELATARTRSAAIVTFAALTLAAIALAVSQLALNVAGGYPGYRDGGSMFLFVPAVFGMLIAPQVALVAGSLAAWGAWRRRRPARLPAGELDLIRRRARVAVAAGLATVIGLELYVADFSSALPAWWLVLVAGLAGVAALALLGAARSLRGARAFVSSTPGEAGDVYDDLPVIAWPWLRQHPWRLGAFTSLLVAFGMTAFAAHAEHSLFEGVQRGLGEGIAAAAGFAALGRSLAVFPAKRRAG
jgi:hypothetical protein